MQIIITDSYLSGLFQGISPGLVKTNVTAHSETMKDLFEKVPHIHPADIASGLIYALGTRPEVQVRTIVNVLPP